MEPLPSMGIALRHLGGVGPVEVLTRFKDFNLQDMKDQNGGKITVPVDTLVAFTAMAFRELGDMTDVWEFQVTSPTEAGVPARAQLYLQGKDVFLVRALSRVL